MINASSTQLNPPCEGRTAGGAADLDFNRPFFWELDLNVFQILTFDVLTVATQLLCQHEKDPQLRPAELQFLLKDLVSKLKHELVVAPARKSAGFPGRGTICNVATVKIVITNLIQLSLCKKGAGRRPPPCTWTLRGVWSRAPLPPAPPSSTNQVRRGRLVAQQTWTPAGPSSRSWTWKSSRF
jgi:hypothetical protein